jgi:succinoglycan biosynthesis protein ExoA
MLPDRWCKGTPAERILKKSRFYRLFFVNGTMVRFSLIIPVKPGGYVKALERLKSLEYPSEGFEVLIAQGRSPSRQRNRAAAEAVGDILYFLDDDSLASPGFLRRAAHQFEESRTAVVGGPSLTPDSDSLLQHAFGLVFVSRFGGGGVRNRYRWHGDIRATGEHELILCNLGFRREIFLELGGFDERLYPNEENELMDRIAASGRYLIHDPGLAVERSQRHTIGAFVRQLSGYGRGRAEQTLISGRIKWIAFVPSLFVCYLALLPFCHDLLLLIPLALYLLLAFLFALREGVRKRELLSALLLPGLFVLFHGAFGVGMIRGFLLYPFRKSHTSSEEITILRIKRFGEPLTE